MNDRLLKRYSDLFSTKNEKFEVANGHIFRLYNRMIVPFGPISEDYSITQLQAKEMLSHLGGVLIRWTKGSMSAEQIKEWYAVVCTDFVAIDSLKSKQRNEVRRGLTNCEVKRIDPIFLSRMGYEIYNSATQSYKSLNISVTSENQFSHDLLLTKDFDDIIHYWGVFSKNRLIAYSTNFIFDDIEASYSSIKFNPHFLNLYPSYALIYEMNKFYLSDNKFKYVNDGFRSILHETNIQNYLIKKFNFHKKYLDLNVYYAPIFGVIVKAIYPFRKTLCKFDKRIGAMMELEKIRRSYYE